MKLSLAGIEFIKQWEKLRLTPYRDANPHGYWTIGYGHRLNADHDFFDMPIDIDMATELLRNDVEIAEDAVNDLVRVALNQHQFDALVSFTYNEGRRHLAESTLLRLLNQAKYCSIPAEMLKWTNAGGSHLEGLVNRRKAEVKLWNTAENKKMHG